MYIRKFPATPFTCDRNEVKPGPFRSGHSIIYNRCLHETGTKITSFQVIPPAGPSRLTSERHEFRLG
jgi:hypothetical protein